MPEAQPQSKSALRSELHLSWAQHDRHHARAQLRGSSPRAWASRPSLGILLELPVRNPKKLTAVALADKMGPEHLAMMVSGETCQRPKGPEPALADIRHRQRQQQKVAISRSEDRDKPGKPVVLRDHCRSWGSRLSTAAA
jgi:hypothetical protein